MIIEYKEWIELLIPVDNRIRKKDVPSNCSAVSTTIRINSDGRTFLTTAVPSSVSCPFLVLHPTVVKPEGLLNVIKNSASHQVTILIAANEA